MRTLARMGEFDDIAAYAPRRPLKLPELDTLDSKRVPPRTGMRAVPHILCRLIDRERDAVGRQDSVVDRERLKRLRHPLRIARYAENEAALPLESQARPQDLPMSPALFGIGGEGPVSRASPHDTASDPKIRRGLHQIGLSSITNEFQLDHERILLNHPIGGCRVISKSHSYVRRI